jgi:glutamate-1-semialdehyde 2,1-aminomutase
VAKPSTTIDRGRLTRLRRDEDAAFRAARPRSARAIADGARHMPNGVPMAWMAGIYRHPPIVAVAGSGARFTDLDGHAYLDMNQVDLSMTCGFAPPAVVEAVARRAAMGTSFLLPTEDALAVTTMLAERWGLPFWQFTLSASSANVEVVRLCRLATGRPRVLVFDGRYHGHIEETMVREDGAGTSAELLGLVGGAATAARVVPFNDLPALERGLAPGDVACIVTEPALTNVGLVAPEPEFHEGVRALADRHGALVVIDETHTLTFAYGGLTRAWDLKPDLVTLGKSLGGGVPIGAYGMTERLARVMERHLDVDVGDHPGLGVGGTLYGNALSLAAAAAALRHVMTPEGYERVDGLGRRLAAGLQGSFDRHGLAWRAPRLGGRSGYCLEPTLPRDGAAARRSIDVDLIDARRVFMANRGIWEAIATAGPAASFAHEAADIDAYVAVADAFLDAITG